MGGYGLFDTWLSSAQVTLPIIAWLNGAIMFRMEFILS